ncbi:MAG: hypothetical protein KYX66_18165 [Blastomonas fulva]|uniref:hypothetical protein n=1 Tax=Blastomonas fulva TaxID=1550728 RepID=UPI0024E20D7A|nr:hypothetical protein [Blastomonas fulva]MDK2758654.1 hypothetical protein [Blastomonas fulva]
MSFAGDFIHLVAFCKIELPTRTLRICDGGFCYFSGEKYEAEDAVFGSIAAVDEFEAALGDVAEDAKIVFLPPASTLASAINRKEFQNSRARFWMGAIGSDGKTVTVAEQQMDALVDFTVLRSRRSGRELEMSFIGRPEKLFLRQEGNSLNPRHHKSIWPGEKGLDNTGSKQTVPWGVGGPRGISSGGGGIGGIGTGGGFNFGSPTVREQ